MERMTDEAVRRGCFQVRGHNVAREYRHHTHTNCKDGLRRACRFSAVRTGRSNTGQPRSAR